jgi:hypothetical protein
MDMTLGRTLAKGVYTAAAAAFLAVALGSGSGELPEFCDEGKAHWKTHGEEGYARRDARRCEGFFERPHAGTGLEIVSFTRGESSAKIDSKVIMRVEVPGVGTLAHVTDQRRTVQNVHVKVQPLCDGVDYQMDASVPPDSCLDWPLDILALATRIQTTKDIGLLGLLGDKPDQIYVPLRLREGRVGREQNASDSLSVVVHSDHRMSNLRWRVYARYGPAPAYTHLSAREIGGRKLAVLKFSPVLSGDTTKIMTFDAETVVERRDTLSVQAILLCPVKGI